MKRVTLVLALVALGFIAVACGGDPTVNRAGGSNNNSSTTNNSTSTADNGDGGGGGAANTLTITITDTSLTLDNATLTDGAVNVKVVNQTTTARSVYIVPGTTPAAELPTLSNGSIDVLNPPPTGVKIAGSIDNVPANGERSKNIVFLPGPAQVFSNAPGDVANGLIQPLTVE